MSEVLTTASTIKCPHGIKVTTKSSSNLTVNGKPVLLESSYGQWSFPGGKCSSTQAACTVVSSISKNAKKLTVNGSPVVVKGFTGTTDGKPSTPMTAEPNQDKLTAI